MLQIIGIGLNTDSAVEQVLQELCEPYVILINLAFCYIADK